MNQRGESFLIGMDGGGSGCRVAIADTLGALLAQAEGGPANVTSHFDLAIAHLHEALDRAIAHAGLDKVELIESAAHIGLAGIMSAQDAARVANEFPFSICEVTDDRAPSVVGALGGQDGVLLAIGTGTIIAAHRQGVATNIGGWGFNLSDQSSGAWLGRGLLERVMLMRDGMLEPGDLTRDTFAHFDNDPAQIVRFAATARPSDYAKHAPAIVAAAAAGDPDGRALMGQGAAYLSRALDVLNFTKTDILCLAGGVGPHYAPYLSPEYQAAIAPAQGTALQGAIRLAQMANELKRGAA